MVSGLTLLAGLALILSGCSFISGLFGHKTVEAITTDRIIPISFSSPREFYTPYAYATGDIKNVLVQTHVHSTPDRVGVAEVRVPLTCLDEPCIPQHTRDKYSKNYQGIFLSDHNKLDPKAFSSEVSYMDGEDEIHVGIYGTSVISAKKSQILDARKSSNDGVLQKKHPAYKDTSVFAVANHPQVPEKVVSYKWRDGTLRWFTKNGANAQSTDRCPVPADGVELLSGVNPVTGTITTGYWDQLLVQGYRIWGTMADDYHPHAVNRMFFDRGAIEVKLSKSSGTSFPDLLSAMRCGSFIAKSGSNAPDLNVVVVEDEQGNKKIKASSERSGTFRFVGLRKHTASGRYVLTSLRTSKIGVSTDSYKIQGNEGFVRVELSTAGEEPEVALSQPVFITPRVEDQVAPEGPLQVRSSEPHGGETTVPAVYRPAKHGKNRVVHLKVLHATLDIPPQTSTGMIKGMTVYPQQRPVEIPGIAYIGAVYEFKVPGGKLSASADLAISYGSGFPTFMATSDLAIFKYEHATKAWIPMTSTVDRLRRQVVASMSAEGIYVLGGLVPQNNKPPKIVFTDPSPGETVSARTTIITKVSDDHGLTSVDFFLDRRYLGTDISPLDTSILTVDLSKISRGKHILSAIGTDFNGATASAEIEIFVESNVDPVQVKIDAVATADAGGVVDYIATGKVSDNAVEVRGYLYEYSPDTWFAVEEPKDGRYSLSVDTGGSTSQNIPLVVVGLDKEGNMVSVSRDIIRNGQQVEDQKDEYEVQVAQGYSEADDPPENVSAAPQDQADQSAGDVVSSDPVIDQADDPSSVDAPSSDLIAPTMTDVVIQGGSIQLDGSVLVNSLPVIIELDGEDDTTPAGELQFCHSLSTVGGPAICDVSRTLQLDSGFPVSELVTLTVYAKDLAGNTSRAISKEIKFIEPVVTSPTFTIPTDTLPTFTVPTTTEQIVIN